MALHYLRNPEQKQILFVFSICCVLVLSSNSASQTTSPFHPFRINFDFSLMYDNNVELTEYEPISDLIWLITPRLYVKPLTRRSNSELGVVLTRYQYFEVTKLNRTDLKVYVDTKYRPSPSKFINFGASYNIYSGDRLESSHVRDNIGDPGAIGTTLGGFTTMPTYPQKTIVSAYTRMELTGAEGSMGCQYAFTSLTHDLDSYRFRNGMIHRLGFNIGYIIMPHLTVSFNLYGTLENFESSLLDSNSIHPYFQLNGRLTPYSDILAGTGYLMRRYVSKELSDTNIFTIFASYKHQVIDSISVSINATRNDQVSYEMTAPAYVSLEVQPSIIYVHHRFQLIFGAFFRGQKYKKDMVTGFYREDDYVGGLMLATIPVKHNLAVTLGYQHVEHNSNDKNEIEYGYQRFEISIRIFWPRQMDSIYQP